MYAIARAVQKHARLISVIEALDNGKPIRETRDADIPLVARHFYHHAGWAQLMEEGIHRLDRPNRRINSRAESSAQEYLETINCCRNSNHTNSKSPKIS